ncbi:YqeG family HAD IIIA-type phosphatase [Sporanaerobium hydrogeniformans]|uniref:YqeG family HAD IIIA-type phosphatase n=1 Tax=Sporanaerobium hydrogeniformans TaxID=3072179 RepID=A0AC61DGN7_9FIRM|nr:YqeG family HAD IIIA-type phosphatase [Sporanaerobium hydrogeniformans]PHV72346.1 YqeG family HAD IIIA-type phosphatase [Sporanaerobium hydrogeniformans]
MNKFFPTEYLPSIYEIDIDELKKRGKKGIIFDIDNTLVPYDVAEPPQSIIAFFEKIRQAGIKITLVSNNTEDRVTRFNQNLKVFALHKSQKPFTKSFKKALELMDCSKEEALIVGDQIFTDVYGGNSAGIETILVVPVSDKDEWITKIKRGLEKRVIKHYEKQRAKHNR